MKEGEDASRTLLFSDVFWLSLSADSKIELARATSPDPCVRRGWVLMSMLCNLTQSDVMDLSNRVVSVSIMLELETQGQ